jgi:hypothetical protein
MTFNVLLINWSEIMDEDLKQNLTATDTWVRGLFMILFLIVYGCAKAVLYLIVFFQFFHTLFTGRPSSPLLDFSENLCAYIYEILLYISFNSNDMPFPFAPWPDEGGGDEGYGDEGERISVAEEKVDEPEEVADEPVEEDQPVNEDVTPDEPKESEEPKKPKKSKKPKKTDNQAEPKDQ